MVSLFALAYLLDLGWLRIGPPYIYININPVMLQLGPLALRWYGFMYVVGIVMGLLAIRGYMQRKGISQELLYRVLWWCIAAGVIGGRLYFVVQQPDLYQDYILKPWNILATWEGGMAFFGAIFLVVATLIWRARIERVNPLVLIDAGVLFAIVGQIFGRIGNLINGDIIGYRSTLPWSTVYQNPHSWACLDPSTCNVPVQPAAAYELLTNIVVMLLLFYLARHFRRPGALTLVYLFSYCITQFLVFFVRDNIIVSFLGLNWGLKQAQWTSIVVFILLIPISFLVLRSRYAQPVPEGEVAVTFGIPQEPKPGGIASESAVVEDNSTESVSAQATGPEEPNKPVTEEPARAREARNVTETTNTADDTAGVIDVKEVTKLTKAE
jgi:phosphatidylglycerol:prolipoprotein diacylglycerol transferase